MRLSEFIRNHRQDIIVEWIDFAESLTPAASNMSVMQLKDHIEQILMFFASDIESAQSSQTQVSKSQGKHEPHAYKDTASQIHGDIRHDDGFDVEQMVSEYRALRASIIKLWTASKAFLSDQDVLDLTRFNEAVDQSLSESVARFMKKMDYSKDLLLGILGHDIRSPMGAITMSAYLLKTVGPLNEKQLTLLSQMENSAARITYIVSDLLDLTQARIGSGLPVHRKNMSVHNLAQQIVEEIQVQHSDRSLILNLSGESHGEYDIIRLGQVFSNLIANAIQYSSKDSAITISVNGKSDEIEISVHNFGAEIPPNQLHTLFESFERGSKQANEISGNLGLGLFISREIIESHEGSINVTSDAEKGTEFFIKLPRYLRDPSEKISKNKEPVSA